MKADKVIIFTGYDDPLWPFIVQECTEEEKSKIFLYTTNNPYLSNCCYNPIKDEVTFVIDKKIIREINIIGILWRRIIFPDFSKFPSDLRLYVEKEYKTFFEGLEYILSNCIWVSKPSAINRARNKTYQLIEAKKLGFNTIDTIFTNSPEEAIKFIKKGDTIFKSIESPRIPITQEKQSTVFTTLLDNENMENICGIISCPGIFQNFCKKKSDIRVTVFKDMIFSVEISSQLGDLSKVDFRRGGRYVPHKIHNLPIDISTKCLQLVSNLSLNFGAIDLALLENGDYIFFEINPNGQWGWLEEITGLPMRRALLDVLFNKK